MFMYMWK